MADEDGNGTVRFQVKDLLTRIDDKLDRIDVKLDQKADRTRLHEVINDLSALQLKVALAEQVSTEFRETQPTIDSLVAWRNRLAGAVVVLSALVLPVAVDALSSYIN